MTAATVLAEMEAQRETIRRLRECNAALRGMLEIHAAIDRRKLASLEKRPYAIGIGTVRHRLSLTEQAIAKAKSCA